MLKFIDANCMIGRRNMCREGAPVSLSDYTEAMDRCGIEKAIVYHSVARENSALTGNRCLEQELPQDGRFLKQWAVLPNVCGEFSPEDQLLAELGRNQVRTVRIFPGAYDYSLKPYVSGRLMDVLAEARVPVFVDKSRKFDWEDLHELCMTYPKARIVLCDPGYRCLRPLVPILERCENLYVETSTYLIHNGIRDFCRRFGAERMIFGSGMPEIAATASTSLIRYADISAEEKQKIASGNIMRLLEEVTL